MTKNIFSILLFTLISLGSFGQMTVATGQTAANYVNNNLIGPGVTVSNVTFTGGANQIGSFNGSSSNIGFNSGIVLSSGQVTELTGPASNQTAGTIGTSGLSNPDLLTIAQSVTTNPQASSISSTTDAAFLEFDFVASSNIVSFNFVFGSDEYLTYVNTQFNDVFGFFVSGPGIVGPYASPAGFPNGAVNLALIPGTNTPVTISTIHPGLNSQYFIDNAGGTSNALNGFTTPIPITFNVQCGQTYHFKFAVADCQDNFLSTAFFLQDDSFTSPPVALVFSTANGTDTIPEACVDADILFVRSECQSSLPLTVDFTVSGTATDGVDFTMASSPIILAAGQDTAVINIIPIIDALIEGTETIIITVNYTDAIGNPQTISGTLYISDITSVTINETDLNLNCFNDSIELTAIASGGSGSFTYDWQSSTSNTVNDYVNINQNGTYDYIITVTDFCLGDFIDTVTVIMNQTLAIDTIYSGPATCEPTGWVSVQISGPTTTPTHGVYYTWNGPGVGNPNFINASVWTDLSSGWYYINVEDAVCTVNDSIFVDILNPPIAQFTATPTSGCSPLNVLFTNSSENASNYAWEFGNGQTANLNSTTSQNQTYTSNAVIRLIASEGNCADTAYANVYISICGCTDPNGINYNPAATVDDGSCIFPTPTVEVPNVFSPNDDGSNDFFFLKTTNAISIEMTIHNRWGNVVYESFGINPSWNGKTENGIELPDGVYFYKYKIIGYKDQSIEGHGFLHLIR